MSHLFGAHQALDGLHGLAASRPAQLAAVLHEQPGSVVASAAGSQAGPAIDLSTGAATSAVIDTLLRLAAEDERLVAISLDADAALAPLAARLAERYFEIPAGDADALAWCVGLATGGCRPVLLARPERLARSWPLLATEICQPRHDAKLLLLPPGDAGIDDGPSGLGLLQLLPHTPVLAPADCGEIEPILELAVGSAGPVAVWLCDADLDPAVDPLPATLARERVSSGRAGKADATSDVALIAWGSATAAAHRAADLLAAIDVKASVLHARFLVPLDEAAIIRMASAAQTCVVLDDPSRQSGFAARVLAVMAAAGSATPASVLLSTPDLIARDVRSARDHFALRIFDRCRWLGERAQPEFRFDPASVRASAGVEVRGGSGWLQMFGPTPAGALGAAPVAPRPAQSISSLPPATNVRPAGLADSDLASEQREIQRIELGPEVGGWIRDYEAVGKRNVYLWRWCLHGLRLTTLPCVEPALRTSLCETKLLAVMLGVMLDDIADLGGNRQLLKLLNGVVVENKTVDLSEFSATEQAYGNFTMRLSHETWSRLRRYPAFDQFEELLVYDHRQIVNAMEYSSLLNGDLSLVNLVEHDAYSPHNMQMMSFATMDLMGSRGFDHRELGRLRAAVWHAQSMGRIGNLLSTWQREVKVRDFTSGVFARALQEGDLELDDLERCRPDVIERAVQRGSHDVYFIERWCFHRRAIEAILPRIRSVDLRPLLIGLKRLIAMELGSQGLKQIAMNDQTLKKLGQHYLIVVMVLTRFIGFLGGALTIYYVNLTLPSLRTNSSFVALAACAVVMAVVTTLALGLFETRGLRPVLRKLAAHEPVELPDALRAGREAIEFCARHHRQSAILVPLVTTLPVCLSMWLLEGAQTQVLVQVCIGTSLGIATSLLLTFFVIERWMQPVVRYLLDRGVPVVYDELPVSHLRLRMNLSFGMIIVITGVMIGALANQRGMDIIDHPEQQAETVASLREHTIYIMVFAVGAGLLLSRMLSDSVASRVQLMLQAMKRVQQGNLDQRLQATGNDEIDFLARQFNEMVEQLGRNDNTIRDLNANLEEKVNRRTKQLSRSKRKLKRSLDRLREYDRLKTEFFSNLSHELRTPLTMILAPVERILDRHGATLPAQVGSMLSTVRINGQRLLELINRLLDFSKLEAGHMRLNVGRLDVNALVGELVAAATPLAEQRNVRLQVDCDPEIVPFGADVEKIDTVISNLFSNALKFTPSGGTVRLETFHTADRVWISVTDSGIGIAESQHARIFERFVQVDGSSSREFAGTGLGLALAKELVDLHGGQLHVRSELGHGSKFWFDLPLMPAPEASAAADETSRARKAVRFADLAVCDDQDSTKNTATDQSTATVLVVDDTPEMRALMGEILGENYQVLFARDGAEGMEVAEREHPDLIVSDVMMPRVDGQEFCRRIKADPATAHVPFIMVTAKAGRDMKIEGLDCGADDYLAKPFDQKELRARVRSLLKLRGLHGDLDKRNREIEAAYRELTSLQGQLVQSEKMSSLGQLVAGLAHEINNAINGVYNGIQPLLTSARKLEANIEPLLSGGGASADSQARENIARLFKRIFSLASVIENGAVRTTRIVSDLKTFSHPDNEKFSEFDLHRSLDMCLNLLSNQIKHRVTVRREYGSVGPVFGPSGQLNQVFMNLLTNAQQAIPGDGEIVLSTSEDESGVTVRVRDSGTGVPPEILGKIFDPFFTTKEPGVGTGLGLSLSYGIVTRLGGTIQCRSTPGEGAEFIVKFARTLVDGGSSGNESNTADHARVPALVGAP